MNTKKASTTSKSIIFIGLCLIIICSAFYYALSTTLSLLTDFNNQIDIISFNKAFFSLFGVAISFTSLVFTDFRILFNLKELSKKGKKRLIFIFLFGFIMTIGGPLFAEIIARNNAEQTGYEYCAEKSGRDLLRQEDTYAKIGKCGLAE